MADLADVEQALVGAVQAALYPTGTSGVSVIGGACRVFRGWPASSVLDADLALGNTSLSVFPVPAATRNTTRWGVVSGILPVVPSLTVSVMGNVASFGGTALAGQLAGLLVENAAYVYRTLLGDTPALVAANLANAMQATRPCSVSGATVTVPGVASVIARVVADQEMVQEWRRQTQEFRLTVWAPTPTLRDAASGAVDSTLSQIAFLMLADGSAGRLRYRSAAAIDDGQDASLYRRDLIYDVEYGTTTSASVPSLLFGDLNFDGSTVFA